MSVLVPKLDSVGAQWNFTLRFCCSQQFQLYLIFILRFREENSMPLPFNYAPEDKSRDFTTAAADARMHMNSIFDAYLCHSKKITLTYHSRWNDARNFTSAWSFSLSLSSWNVNRNQKRFHQKSESKTAQQANFLRFFSKFKRQIMKSFKIFFVSNLDLIGNFN